LNMVVFNYIIFILLQIIVL
ncbi:hypothetical protein A5873_002559, partial [Enterococcus faecium]